MSRLITTCSDPVYRHWYKMWAQSKAVKGTDADRCPEGAGPEASAGATGEILEPCKEVQLLH